MTQFSRREKILLHQLFTPDSITRLIEILPETSESDWKAIREKVIGEEKESVSLMLYVDGAADSKAKNGGIGGIILRNDNSREELVTFSENIGEATNNEAEYKALIRGLEYAAELNGTDVLVNSDSELIVNQVNLEYKVKNKRMLALHRKARSILGKFASWQVRHIPRDDNRKADTLSKLALVTEEHAIR